MKFMEWDDGDDGDDEGSVECVVNELVVWLPGCLADY
jgi:hypothetical protein